MSITQFINKSLEGKSPAFVLYGSVGAIVGLRILFDLFYKGRLWKRLGLLKWRIIRVIGAPIIRREVRKAASGMKFPSTEGEYKALKLPEKGTPANEVISMVSKFHEQLDIPYQTGGFSGTVYNGTESHTRFMNRVMEIFQWSNPLHSEIFGATRKMEAEVVSMVVSMYNGDKLPDACGVVTSGGTESICMAIKTYRDWARAEKGITDPCFIAPVTIHPAFDKGCEYFGVELIKIPVDPVTFKVNPKEVEKYIRYNTIAIAGSAPNFPHGIIDPIEELSEIAYKHKIGMHVDACLGGFIMPFMEKAGFNVPLIDFRLRGVTSISCDTHKYGFAPKGTSTVMYRTKNLRSYEFCCIADWPGGIYCSPAVSGSKPGNVIAGTWAAMVFFGESGYVDACRKIVSARAKATTALSQLPYIKIVGEPLGSVFAMTSTEIDIFVLGDELAKRGWILNRLQYPSGLQFSVTYMQATHGVMDKFISDVQQIGDEMHEAILLAKKEHRKIKKGETGVTMYGSQQKIQDRSIIKDVLKEYLAIYYSPNH